MRRIIGATVIAAMATGVVAFPAIGQEGAKAAFYSGSSGTVIQTPRSGPGPQPSQVARSQPGRDSYLGLAYWVELLGADGQTRRVTADRIFRSGDRIRLHVQSNRNGFLYMINLGSTGRSTVLFPNAATAVGGNAIQPGMSYPVPHNGFFRFDDNPGEEVVVIMLSSVPMAGLEAAEPAMLLGAAQAKGAKDLLVEVDARAAQPATYAVAPLSSLREGGLISLRVSLKHQ